MKEINFSVIEKKWQKFWEDNSINTTKENSDKKFYILDMFPYPSGEGLHVGHPKGYIATDVYSLMKKMQGYDVLHPMGFDAFGLPAEQFALKNKVNPNISTAKNVARYKEQLKMLGLNYDWSREINTTDPKFYKWTQWMWKQMYKKGLAYESYDPINWCPSCKTGLANEDLEGNACERCGTLVEKKTLRQWTIRITDYADRLLADLDKLDWEPHIKELQKNWIGKSEGAEIDFPLVNFIEKKQTIFTTRPDTLYGATFLAVSYELAQKWIDGGWGAAAEVKAAIEEFKNEEKKLDFSFKEVLEKKGIDTGIKAVNPATGKEMPVWIANYVLSGYGTGAIMAVPAHDERDFEFADKYGIEIKSVVAPKDIYRGIVVGTTLKDNQGFKKELDINKIKYELAISKISGREQIRFEVNKKDLDIIIPIIQENIIEGNWVDILGSQSILLLKNSINFDYMENHQEWFDKMNVKESFLNGQKNFWHLLFKNDFLKTFLCYSDYGILINSGEFDGLTSQEAKTKIVEKVGGKMKSQYKLREWVFARQRYWGEPFPIVFDENHKSYAVADSELPVVLPQVDDYEPTGTGESPLANIKEFTDVYGYINTDGEFESVNGIHSEREINTIKYYTDQEQDYFTNTVHEEKDIYEDVKSELDYIGDKFKGSRTLEIGSAFCRDAKYLRNKGVDIVCSDISDIFSSYSDYNNFEFLNIDPTTSEIGVKVYDNVVALASLLHSENNNLKKIIKKINIATKDGGYIYLRMQNGEGEEFKNNKGGERFFNLVNESSISGILVESGYEVERVTYSHEDGKTPKKWINVLAKKVEHFEAKLFRRETNTMPQWAGSSWYYLRFIDPHNNDTFVDKNKEAKWSPVDFYVGGAEHATRHLIYARFWHKFLFDLGLVSTDEPFLKLQTVGLIMAEDGRKMSKRWGNIINPDDIIREYGADTLRLYEMFMGPFDQAVAWNTSAMSGVKRFLERFVRISEKVDASATLDKNLDYFLNLTIKKVTEDIEKFKFNTAISQMMILLNEAEKYEKINSDFYLKFVKIISPFTPFLAEELYADMAFTDKKISIREEAWPLFDVSKLEKDLFVYAVQVNGKLRGEIEVSKDMSKEDILQLARSQENVKKWLDGETVKKEILIEGKLVNFVI